MSAETADESTADPDAVYAARCQCEAFGVSSHGADGWDRHGITQLARSHLQRCPANADSIDVVQRTADRDEVVEVVER